MSARKQSYARLAQLVESTCYYLEPTGPFGWYELFGNLGPVEIDVGCGKGLFLVSGAAQYPKRNFFGIDMARKYAMMSADRAMRHGLENVRVARADAGWLLHEWVPDNSVSVMHVYFPDPWWKRRHRKRRLFTEVFIDSVARVLQPGGQLRVASDVEEYFQVIEHLAGGHPSFVPVPSPPEHCPEHDLDYLSNFERKYRKDGRCVFRAHFAKRGRKLGRHNGTRMNAD